VSIGQAHQLADRFLGEPSGGDRGLALAAALFETVRERLGIFTEVRRGAINVADAAGKAAADIECIGPDGGVVLAVEVKERQITQSDIEGAVAKARSLGVRELLFCSHGIVSSDQMVVAHTVERVWASGTNLYEAPLRELVNSFLLLLGEDAIREFVVNVGRQLDRYSTQPRHRRTWKALLDAL
jgi:hypothetical protein